MVVPRVVRSWVMKQDVRREIENLILTFRFPERVVDRPGRVRFTEGPSALRMDLESRETTHAEWQALFGDDPMDASY